MVCVGCYGGGTCPMRMAGMPLAAGNCPGCPGSAPARRYPGCSSASRQSAQSTGWWSRWCPVGWCSPSPARSLRWPGRCPGAPRCRSAALRAVQPPRTASSACPPSRAAYSSPLPRRSPSALCLPEEKNHRVTRRDTGSLQIQVAAVVLWISGRPCSEICNIYQMLSF